MAKLTLLASTALALALAASAANAQPVTGPYVSLGAGYNILQDSYQHTDPAVSGIPGNDSTRFRWGEGFNGEGSLGYGLGNTLNGVRVEFEGAYYNNNVQSRVGSPVPGYTNGHRDSYGGLFNAFYDLDLNGLGIPTFGLTPMSASAWAISGPTSRRSAR